MHRILVVDDTEAIHDDFRKILTGRSGCASSGLQNAKAALFGGAPAQAAEASFEVDSAQQGEEGLKRVEAAIAAKCPYSVAFVDMRMPPGWDGLRTVQALWKADPEIQVVICTAFSDRSWEEISSTLGLSDKLLVLKKPFDPVEVLQAATALSEKWELSRKAALKLDELERLVEQRTNALAHAALHDRLTGMPNRAFLRDRLTRTVAGWRSGDRRPFALYFLDFDRFKVVNDSLGHDAGDQLLIEIGRRINGCLVSPECAAMAREFLAARMGGDEFVIVADGLASAANATRIAEVLRAALSLPYALSGYSLVVTASIGITTSDLNYDTPDGAIRDADMAMYHAKAAGKAQWVVFDRRMHEKARDRLALENDIRRAVDGHEWRLHYQPMVCLTSGRLRGFEALLRWNHAQRGEVRPDEFIPCAEEIGVIVQLGEWVLREACQQAVNWGRRFPGTMSPGAPGPCVSVNVSAKQLALPQFVGQVEGALKATGLDPRCLAIEITESAVIHDLEFTVGALRRIRDMGVDVYMDDFGTGYSSLSCLHKLPLTALKVDRSFMQSMSERRDYAAVVQSIVSLAHNLGIKVVAEGVESADQVAMLQTMECDLAQGFHFGRPAEPLAAERLLANPQLAQAA